MEVSYWHTSDSLTRIERGRIIGLERTCRLERRATACPCPYERPNDHGPRLDGSRSAFSANERRGSVTNRELQFGPRRAMMPRHLTAEAQGHQAGRAEDR